MTSTLLLEKDEMARILDRLASQIQERHAQCGDVMLVGIQRGARICPASGPADGNPPFLPRAAGHFGH